VLFGCGIYLMLRRNVVKLLLGIMLLSQATNLLIFTAGGLRAPESALIPPGETVLSSPYPDPLPQALVLTAIVIGFGVLAFAIVLVQQAYRATGTEDMDDMRSTDA
jgi:multicomponent Na+:H+ antiporter subunit C